MVLKNLDISMQNNELYTKVNTQWIIDLDVKCKTIETWKHKRKSAILNQVEFLDMTPNTSDMEGKMNKLDFINTKTTATMKIFLYC